MHRTNQSHENGSYCEEQTTSSFDLKPNSDMNISVDLNVNLECTELQSESHSLNLSLRLHHINNDLKHNVNPNSKCLSDPQS